MSVLTERILWRYFCPASSMADIFVLMNFIDYAVNTLESLQWLFELLPETEQGKTKQ